MRWRWKTLIIIATVLVTAFLGISAYLGHTMTTVKRVPIQGSPADLGLQYQDVSFQSRTDNLTLRGWLIPSGNSREIIIIVHGSDENRADPSIDTLGIAAALAGHDYSVLMFDLRGHGESGGSKFSAGYYEKRDLLGAVDFVKGRGYRSTGVLGFSMGAATAIFAAAEDDDIDCIVADSCYADITEIMKREFSARTRFPGFFLSPVLFTVKLFYGVDFPAVKPVAVVPEIAPRPILFIHGADDTFLPPDHAARLLAAADNPADELWIVPGAEHVKSYVTNRQEYIDRITAFFDAVLK
ncbi:MAG: alpha/beta hydrolase [Dehalococcoidales bacterium]|jgi:fermentation-respiration switch protein FrsA (DUF1100 family)